MNNTQQTETLWCFKRWSRKPWAAFAGMCRFKIGVLSVAMSIILLASHPAGAQSAGNAPDGERIQRLDSVGVTAHRAGAAAPLPGASQIVVPVDRKAPAGNAEAILRLVPAVDVRERGGRSSQADIAIRGGSFDQTMVMLNGIDFSDARTGHQSHALPVDVDVLSAIAVVDGAVRPGALAGAVDMRTHAAPPYLLRARMEGGRWGWGYGNVSGGWSGGGLQTLGALSYGRSDGYRHGTDHRNVNAYARAIYEGVRLGRVDIQGGFQRRRWGSNGFYALAWPDQYESTRTLLASARWEKRRRRWALEAVGSWRRNDDRFGMVRSDPASFNHHTTYAAFASLEARHDWSRAGQSALGASFTDHTMLSTKMGEELSAPRHRVPTLDGVAPTAEFYTRRAARNIVGVWASHRKAWGRTWARGDAHLGHTPYGRAATFAVEAGVRPADGVALKASALRSTRLPTFTELYYNVGGYHPDPGLHPERAMTYRLSAAAARGAWSGETAVWYRRTRNVIDWEQRTGDRPGDVKGDWYATQLNRLGTVGAELAARYEGRGWLRGAALSYGRLHSEMTVATDYISKYALDYMRHKLSGSVGLEPLRGVVVALSGPLGDRVGSYIAADGPRGGYDPCFLVDGRLSWSPARAAPRGWSSTSTPPT
jgi:iron complex outermembrane receptor protein